MERFLSGEEAAAYLGVSIDEANARLAVGTFPPASVVIGEYYGWARGVLDTWQAPRSRLCCDYRKVCEAITRIRQIAETIRSHGYGADSSIAGVIPRDLYALSGRIESEMRRLRTMDYTLAKGARSEPDDAETTQLDYEGLPAVPSFAVHPALRAALDEPMLRQAADGLDAVGNDLSEALESGNATTFRGELAELAARVRRHADTLIDDAGQAHTAT